MALSIHDIYRGIWRIWRRRRFAWFIEKIRPQRGHVLLDVGGYPTSWTGEPQPVKRIDTLNLHPVSWNCTEAPDHHICTLVGDGCGLDMADDSYDIVFSNSVIEHVGTWGQQQKFAREIRRVARRIWVQTPAYECPIEPHYLAPAIHYLPKWAQRRMIRWLTLRGWLERPSQSEIDFMVDTTRLLTRREMEVLFPDCEILTERLLWVVPKSYIAVRI